MGKRATSCALFRGKGTAPQFLRGTVENVLHNRRHAANRIVNIKLQFEYHFPPSEAMKTLVYSCTIQATMLATLLRTFCSLILLLLPDACHRIS